MGGVVCATRGGEGSRAAQLHAIRKAQEKKIPLAFLYVADRRAAIDHPSSLDEAIEQELIWLGRVLLNVAKERAARAGIEADIHVSLGAVKEEIIRFMAREDAGLLVLGAPRNTTTVFGDDAIELFAADIQKQTGVRVEIARPADL